MRIKYENQQIHRTENAADYAEIHSNRKDQASAFKIEEIYIKNENLSEADMYEKINISQNIKRDTIQEEHGTYSSKIDIFKDGCSSEFKVEEVDIKNENLSDVDTHEEEHKSEEDEGKN